MKKIINKYFDKQELEGLPTGFKDKKEVAISISYLVVFSVIAIIVGVVSSC